MSYQMSSKIQYCKFRHILNAKYSVREDLQNDFGLVHFMHV